MSVARKLRPIPKRLLVHEIEYERFEGDGPFGSRWGQRTALKHVRVEPSSQIRRSYEGVDVDIKSVLFIDQTNSKDAVELPTQSKVYWRGLEMVVVECKTFYGFDGETPHHYEVMLV